MRRSLFVLLLAAFSTASEMPRAKWIEHGLIDAGGSHEPYIFVARTGGARRDVRQQLDRAQSEETLRRLKAQGVEVFHTHLYKGFGMAAEKPEMEETRRVAALAHKLGLKVDTYIQWNSLMYETFFAEEPRGKDWIQRDAAGQPILLTYDYEQSFRYRPCFSNPDYLTYLKRIVRYAVEEVKTDFIHFDNFDLNPEPESCHCDYCVRGFRKHLESKYPPEVRKERFGFSNVEFIQPPLWNTGNQPQKMTFIRDPGIQEWIDFRCQMMSDALKEMAQYAKGLNPEVAIEVNPHGITGGNRAFEAGLDHARFLKYTEVFWTEEENEPGMLADGRLISKIRSYKLARAFDNILLAYTANSDVALAESLAFNQTFGFAGSDPLDAHTLKYIAFYKQHRDLYVGARDMTPVGVLRSYPSITYNNPKTQLAAILTEQALIQSHIPFGLVFDEQLADLSPYKVLVLPDSECLSDAQFASIRRFVERGGGIVSIGDSGKYDEWRRERLRPGLADLAGRDRVASIATAEFDGQLPSPEPFGMIGNRFWRRPRNWRLIVDGIRHVASGGLGADVGGPESLVANLVAQPNRLLLHLVNYAARAGSTGPIPVELQLPAGKTAKEVTLISPDRQGEQKLESQQPAGATVRVAVPGVEVYSIVAVSF